MVTLVRDMIRGQTKGRPVIGALMGIEGPWDNSLNGGFDLGVGRRSPKLPEIEGSTTRLQKEMSHIQQEMSQMQADLSQLNGKMDELHGELQAKI
ncbi:hypothetical protein CXB51_034365 [Gossypium anomalum]|uniref:Uncharacterized protein n=1 Tax=Gossypium anomalum TaxID=47600 RepID=A0A8J6CIU7_9ROSI|nr:hypothetical protein CXB51_034365 [Gossypium anomalum]